MKEIILAAILVVIGSAALVSAIAFSAFGYFWWTPFAQFDVRAVILFGLHAVAVVSGATGLHYLFWRFSDDDES